MASKKRVSGTYSVLTYDIAEKSRFPNPSEELRECGVRLNLSTWVIPTAHIPWELIDRMKEAKVKHRLHKFDLDEDESIRAEAKEELEAETARIHGSLIKALDKATTEYNKAKEALEARESGGSPNEWTEAVRGWERAGSKALERAGEHLNAAVLCAEKFDQTMELEDVLQGLRESINSRQAAYEAQSAELRSTHSITVVNGQGRRSGPLGNIYGHAVTGVLRWMGANGWSKEEARAVLNKCGCESYSSNTIALQVNDGKTGKFRYGPLPELPDSVVESLEADLAEVREAAAELVEA